MLSRFPWFATIVCAAALAQSASPRKAPAAPEESAAWLHTHFAQPPAAYSTMPFLVWNGEVTEVYL